MAKKNGLFETLTFYLKEKGFKNLTIPNFLTYIGLFFALIGIYLLIKHEFILAIIFLTLTDVFDMADGYIARKFKMFSPLGADLDNLVDVIAFVVPPFIIALMIDNTILILVAVFYVSIALYRLARFRYDSRLSKVDPDKIYSSYGKGLSICPPAHLIYTGILIGIAHTYLALFYVLFGILMFSTIKIKKKHTTYFLLSIIVINLILATILLMG